MARELTKKQEQIFQYVMEYCQREGFPPSIREIGRDFNISSLRGVTIHLDALAKKGYISRSNQPRSIKIIHPQFGNSNKSVLLPLVGSIAAGVPILAQEHVEDLIPVPAEMVRNIERGFLLRVRGDSMTGEGIMPRDLVIIKPQQTAQNGDLVAALIGDEATVKRIQFGPNSVRLMPSNPAYNPIEIKEEDARIIGKVVGLLRDYEAMAF